MSKIIRTSKPSVLPWYAAALVFVVLCAVLPVYQLWALLVSLGGACAAFGTAKKICLPRVVEHEVPFHTGVDDVELFDRHGKPVTEKAFSSLDQALDATVRELRLDHASFMIFYNHRIKRLPDFPTFHV